MDEITKYVFGAGAPMAVLGLGWWLKGQFRNIEVAQIRALSKHEAEDERRHIENLDRFKVIAVALARMGYKGGAV